jgi:hypothetical protein
VVAAEHDLVPALEQDVRECRPPRPGPGDQESHKTSGFRDEAFTRDCPLL